MHKKLNVLSQLPESEKAEISKLMTAAYLEFEYGYALTRLKRIVKRLEYRYPATAASLREGIEETLMVHRLGVSGLLRSTFFNTNLIESANSVCVGASYVGYQDLGLVRQRYGILWRVILRLKENLSE